MKKPLSELTIAEAENLIKCKDDNGGWMCRKGCPFRVTIDNLSCCHKNAFYARLETYFAEQGLISQNDNGEWEIELK